MATFEAGDPIDTNRELAAISVSEEVELLREQVKLLREQIESWHLIVEHLGLELLDKQQQIQALEEELVQTNKELCHALTTSQPEIDRAKQVSVSEALVVLLNAVDSCAIPAKKREAAAVLDRNVILPNTVAQQILNKSKELRTRSQQLNPQFNELGFQFISQKASFMKFQEKVGKQLIEVPQQCEDETILSQRLQAYQIMTKANVTQIQEQVEQTKKLLNKSKTYVKLVKSRLATSAASKKSAKVGLS